MLAHLLNGHPYRKAFCYQVGEIIRLLRHAAAAPSRYSKIVSISTTVNTSSEDCSTQNGFFPAGTEFATTPRLQPPMRCALNFDVGFTVNDIDAVAQQIPGQGSLVAKRMFDAKINGIREI